MTLAEALTRGPERVAAAAWPLRLALMAALGALMALGQVPFSWPIVTLAVLLVVMQVARHGAGFRDGWALGLGHFALSLRWITEPFFVEPERTGWMAPFALVLMAGGLAVFWGAAFWASARLRTGAWGLVILWTAVEIARSYILTGFPWALVGHVWVETPLAQAVAWVGAHGLTLMTLAVAAALTSSVLPVLRAGVAAALAGAAILLDPGPAPDADPDAPIVRVVQPNVPQDEKWDPALQSGHLRRLVELSRGHADLVVWPETALADLLEWSQPTLTAAAGVAGAPIATGVVRADDAGRYYNSLVVTDRLGEVADLYDKVHLVPFGEYIPFRALLSRWGMDGLAEFQGEGFTAGPGAEQVDIPGIGAARPLICYEGIFAEEIGRERPRFLLLVTNDAWFGTQAGPQQHFALGRLRAIEQGLPIVRAANTGISALIDPRGRILASLPLGETGAIEAALPHALPPTPYSRTGDAPILALLVLLGGAVLWRRGLDRGASPL